MKFFQVSKLLCTFANEVLAFDVMAYDVRYSKERSSQIYFSNNKHGESKRDPLTERHVFCCKGYNKPGFERIIIATVFIALRKMDLWW